MSSRKLGRGLDSLLQGTRKKAKVKVPEPVETQAEIPLEDPAPPLEVEQVVETAPTKKNPSSSVVSGDSQEIHEISMTSIEPNPYQPRLAFDAEELHALKTSIKREGVLQPILVRPVGEGYQLVAGERRFRASQELGEKTIPAIVKEIPDEKLLEIALIENLHRENLSPIDTAKAFQQLIELKAWTQDALAKHLGISRPAVSNALRLLELPEKIQRSLSRGHIQVGHAKVLLSIDSEADQLRLFDKIAEDRLSVRDLEVAREAADVKTGKSRTRRPIRKSKPSNIRNLERELTEKLGSRVTIQEKKGKGIVKIEFYSPEDFQGIRKILMGGKKK